MRVKRVVVALALPLLGVGLVTPMTAQASSWKRGTPKAVRGSWFNKGVHNAKKNVGWTAFNADKHSFGIGHMGMPSVVVYHPYYKYAHHTYFLKGYAPRNGLWRGSHVLFKLVKKGKKLHLVSNKGTYDNVMLHRDKVRR